MDSSGAIPQSLVESITYQNKGLYSFAFGDRLPLLDSNFDDAVKETVKDEELTLGKSISLYKRTYRIEEQLGPRTYRVSDRDGKMCALNVESLERPKHGPHLGVSCFFCFIFLRVTLIFLSVSLKLVPQ